MRIPLVVLNYNGRRLLAECLPSLVRAAVASRHDCRVVVIDNCSTDDSRAYLAAEYPHVDVVSQPNRGLCSYNPVLAALDDPIVVLLNNDVKLAEDCVDRLVEPLLKSAECGVRNAERVCSIPHSAPRIPHSPAARPCFLAAPFCYRFDGVSYEGQKTAVSWRWGIVQGTSFYPGYAAGMHQPGPTASAGAVLAVDRRVFVALGGFDPLYLPGRIEDLDFAYRGYLAGYRAVHVPDAIAYHLGGASFGPAHGQAGCDVLALRNTLLFQWKNLVHPLHLAREAAGWPLRLLLDVVRAPFAPRERRWSFVRAWAGAWRRRSLIVDPAYRPARSARREWAFFQQFHPMRINRPATSTRGVVDPPHGSNAARSAREEAACH